MTSYLGPGEQFRVKGLLRKPCKSLLCGECGIRVSKYEGYRWTPGKTNYLFFRANFSDFERLSSAMDKDPDSVAYSCGCKGYCVEEGEPVPPGYQWKCTGCDL